jgi:hypothetical protein
MPQAKTLLIKHAGFLNVWSAIKMNAADGKKSGALKAPKQIREQEKGYSA